MWAEEGCFSLRRSREGAFVRCTWGFTRQLKHWAVGAESPVLAPWSQCSCAGAAVPGSPGCCELLGLSSACAPIGQQPSTGLSLTRCDADPSALANYVVALVKKDKPEKELKAFCADQLDVFLQKGVVATAGWGRQLLAGGGRVLQHCCLQNPSW